MSTALIEVVRHVALTPWLTEELRLLFDAEYLADFGEWDPEQPYGYAPHEVNLMTHVDGDIVLPSPPPKPARRPGNSVRAETVSGAPRA